MLEWFDVDRTRQAVDNWYENYTEYSDQEFTVTLDPSLIIKKIQLEEEQKVWLYAAIDVDEKVVLHTYLSPNWDTKHATQFLRELKDIHEVEYAKFLVDEMGYLTALAQTDLNEDLNHSDRNSVEKIFQTVLMRIGRFHETWNASQASADR